MKKPVKKENLPTKTCVACGRPFSWRKKWEKVWDQVKYCSERCRQQRKTGNNRAYHTFTSGTISIPKVSRTDTAMRCARASICAPLAWP